MQESGFIALPQEIFSGSRVIITGLLAFLITSVIIRMMQSRVFRLFEGELEIEQRIFFTKLLMLSLYILAAVITLYSAGLSIDNATLILGLMTTGLAFAIRDVLTSFIAWIIILNKNPFRIGDYLTVDTHSGQVIRIGTFYVTLDGADASDESVVRVPNKTFLDKSFFNYGKDSMIDTIKYPIKKMSDYAKLEKKLEGILDTKELSLDVEGEKKYFIVRYRVSSAQRHDLRTRILRKLG